MKKGIIKEEDKIYLGTIDNQSPEEKEKNYKQSEVVASVALPTFPAKERENFLRYPIRSQGKSSRCVTFTLAKELSIWFYQKYGVWVDFSTCFNYQLRSNPEVEGCSSYDVFTLFPKLGNIFEQFMLGDGLGEKECMAVKMPSYAKDMAKFIEFKKIALPIDFDTVASTLQKTGKGVMLWFKFNKYEWKDIPITSQQASTSGHSITAIEPITYKGVEYILCDESWGLGYSMDGQRLISRDYFNARCYQASYIMSFDMTPRKAIERPKFDGSIMSAQRCFKWEGLFANNIDEIESWGNITRKACKEFQKRYNIAPAEGNFGPITHAKLVELYS